MTNPSLFPFLLGSKAHTQNWYSFEKHLSPSLFHVAINSRDSAPVFKVLSLGQRSIDSFESSETAFKNLDNCRRGMLSSRNVTCVISTSRFWSGNLIALQPICHQNWLKTKVSQRKSHAISMETSTDSLLYKTVEVLVRSARGCRLHQSSWRYLAVFDI